MAVGSGFDAFVKSAIHDAIFGQLENKGSMFDFETLFESQVEAHIRDETFKLSSHLFKNYVSSGAYGSLLSDIQASPFAPEMEFDVTGEVEGVPLLGKPDLRYITKEGVHVVADWKVNGSTSKIGASPLQGYKICRDYGSSTNGKAHKKYKPMTFKDVECNEAYLEEFVPYWADQLAIYSWLLGEAVGSEEFVIRMEQVACRPQKDHHFPRAKFATHMARISKAYQEKLMARIHAAWDTIESGYIFTHLSAEESQSKCNMLDGRAKVPSGLHPVLAAYTNSSTRFKPKAN
jgi:hypothetical protein